MMKYFRKHMKHLLVIFMSLLVVVWVGGSALTSMMRRKQSHTDEILGETFGRPVQYAELQPVFHQVETLSALSIRWQIPWYAIMSGRIDLRTANLRNTPLSEYEWFMLDLAARNNDIYISPDNAKELRTTQLPGQLISSIRKNRGLSLDQIDSAIESYLRVIESAISAISAVKVSEADIQYFARNIFEKVRVNVVVLDAKNFIDKSYNPTEKEIKEQFEQYKNTASQPEATLDFGYQLPEAVQIEYVKIKSKVLEDRQQIAEKDAFEYWNKHQTEFLMPTTRPATAPAIPPKPETPKPYPTFIQAKPDVIEKLKEIKARADALQLARETINQLNRPWMNSPTTKPDNYRQPPESETADDIYPQVVTRMQDKYAGVLEYGRSKLVDMQTITSVRDIGPATLLPGTRQSVPFGWAAFMVAGLENKPKDFPKQIRYFRNIYETCAEPAVDKQGNAYVFRTIAARAKQPPSSLDMARDRIIEDIRLQRAYDETKKQAQILADKAVTDGLKETLDGMPELKQKLDKLAYKPLPPFSRKTFSNYYGQPRLNDSYVMDIGSQPEFLEKAFKAIKNKTTSQPATTQSANTFIHDLPFEMKWVVAEAVELIPVTREQYDNKRTIAINYIIIQRQVEVLNNWFSPEQIMARVGWKYAQPQTKEETTEKDKENQEES